MHDVQSVSDRLLKACEEAGYAARGGGLCRVDNPYSGRPDPRSVPLTTAEARRALADAWWRGWDRAEAGGEPAAR